MQVTDSARENLFHFAEIQFTRVKLINSINNIASPPILSRTCGESDRRAPPSGLWPRGVRRSAGPSGDIARAPELPQTKRLPDRPEHPHPLDPDCLDAAKIVLVPDNLDPTAGEHRRERFRSCHHLNDGGSPLKYSMPAMRRSLSSCLDRVATIVMPRAVQNA